MLNIIIFGPPGSGKGTQSARIVQDYELVHLSTGDLFREEMSKNSEIGILAKKYIDRGLLVPDEIVLAELQKKAGTLLSKPGIIFDGFPRTLVQAEKLDQMLKGFGISLDMVLSVEVPEDELYKRLMGRGVDSGRTDDGSEIILHRIEVYKQQTFPLIDYYKQQGKLVAISGMAQVDQVYLNITKALNFYINNREILSSVS